MAEVIEAAMIGEKGFERKVAIKRLLPELIEDEALVDSFVDEARLASMLHHPSVVGVLDFGVIDGVPFQLLELVNGVDLSELDNRAREAGRRIPIELALHIVYEVASALDYVHHASDDTGRDLGIVHRDINPRNILISWVGAVMVSDFGVAQAFHRAGRTEAGVAKGTLSYMAPEQLRFEGVDGRADLFALGCVLHRLIADKSPLEGTQAREHMVAQGTLELSSSLPEDVRTIIGRATRPQPADRYARGSEMARDCWKALTHRLDRDARSFAADWMRSLQSDQRRSRPAPGALAELMDVDLLFDEDSGPVRQFTAVKTVGSEDQQPTVVETGAGDQDQTEPGHTVTELVPTRTAVDPTHIVEKKSRSREAPRTWLLIGGLGLSVIALVLGYLISDQLGRNAQNESADDQARQLTPAPVATAAAPTPSEPAEPTPKTPEAPTQRRPKKKKARNDSARRNEPAETHNSVANEDGIKDRLEQVKAQLAQLRETEQPAPSPALDALEERYLRLRMSIRPNLSEPELKRLAKEIAGLERSAKALRGRPSD